MQAYEMSWIYRKDQDTVRRMYYLTLMDPKLKVKERFGGVLLEEKKDEWKEAFDETVSRAGKSEGVRRVEEMFNQEETSRRRASGELLSRWKSGYRTMI